MSNLNIDMQTLMFVGYASQGHSLKALTSRSEYIKNKYSAPKMTPKRALPHCIIEE